MGCSKLYKLATLYASAAYLEREGPKYTKSIPGYKRMTEANEEIQQKAYQILNQIYNKPWGTQVPFTTDDGTKYMAVLEEHVGGAIPGPHPGISVFINDSSQFSARTEKILARLNAKFKPMVEQLLLEAKTQGLNPELVSGTRSMEEQQRIYNQGRTTPGQIVSGAKPGISLHNYGMAVDIAALDDKGKLYYPDATFYQRLATIAGQIGMKWGGNWTAKDGISGDMGHFQYPITAAQARQQAPVSAPKPSPQNDLDKLIEQFLA
jgi:hypothetical protein